ncbi:MAG: ABC transporter permease [Pleurocapsa sp. SU_196_0]|nr:ABC transporter permease [Pleurocapsa sp. SU_196_0]
MLSFALRRLLYALPTLVVVTIMVFALVRVLPGDPALLMLGEEANPELVKALNRELGLDQPLTTQYLNWIGGAIRGDLGASLRNNESVTRLVAEKLPTTLELSLLAMLVALALAIPAGVFTAVRRGGAADGAVTVLALSGISLPNFFLGVLLIYFFSVQLGWIPPSGYVTPAENLGQNLLLMLMPAITLGTGTAGVLTRFLRGSMLEVLTQDFVRTARAKGAGPRAVVYRHALRNAVLPVLTIFGLQLSALLSGAVITEQIFSIPGFGRLLVEAVATRDFPVLQGVVLISSVSIFAVSFLVDLMYASVDPRIRYQ